MYNKPHGEELKARQNFHGVHNRELDLILFLFGSHLGNSGVPSIRWVNQDAVWLILKRQAACTISSDPVDHHFALMKDWLMFVCVVTWSHRMSVTWLSQQSGLRYRSLFISMEYLNFCHERFTWYMTSKELDKVTGICCWESFQPLPCSNV